MRSSVVIHSTLSLREGWGVHEYGHYQRPERVSGVTRNAHEMHSQLGIPVPGSFPSGNAFRVHYEME